MVPSSPIDGHHGPKESSEQPGLPGGMPRPSILKRSTGLSPEEMENEDQLKKKAESSPPPPSSSSDLPFGSSPDHQPATSSSIDSVKDQDAHVDQDPPTTTGSSGPKVPSLPQPPMKDSSIDKNQVPPKGIPTSAKMAPAPPTTNPSPASQPSQPRVPDGGSTLEDGPKPSQSTSKTSKVPQDRIGSSAYPAPVIRSRRETQPLSPNKMISSKTPTAMIMKPRQDSMPTAGLLQSLKSIHDDQNASSGAESNPVSQQTNHKSFETLLSRSISSLQPSSSSIDSAKPDSPMLPSSSSTPRVVDLRVVKSYMTSGQAIGSRVVGSKSIRSTPPSPPSPMNLVKPGHYLVTRANLGTLNSLVDRLPTKQVKSRSSPSPSSDQIQPPTSPLSPTDSQASIPNRPQPISRTQMPSLPDQKMPISPSQLASSASPANLSKISSMLAHSDPMKA